MQDAWCCCGGIVLEDEMADGVLQVAIRPEHSGPEPAPGQSGEDPLSLRLARHCGKSQ